MEVHQTPRGRRPRIGFVIGAVVSTTALLGALAAGVAQRTVAPAWSKVDPALVRETRVAPSAALPLIVRESTPPTPDAEDLVRSLGGTVGRELPIVGGFSATLPASELGPLSASPTVLRVWGDARLTSNFVDIKKYDTWTPNKIWRTAIGLDKTNRNGAGITVALLDTGINPMKDLGNRVLERVDLTPDHDGYDKFGHGTHMSGLIAGNGQLSGGLYPGAAPAANLVSVKVASWDGSTDVSAVIAGMQWVIAHRSTYKIRVLNLSYGTDSRQGYALDPLDYAVEQVWLSGIFVVVSAGNRGPDPGTIDKPADDPFVMTVGAATTNNSVLPAASKDADFSSLGPTQDGFAKPDLLAPGISIVSLRDQGSTVDMLHPDARVDTSYFKGSGTSQAAAIVSGVAADVFQQNPKLTPDMMKALLISTASSTSSADGTKLVDAVNAVNAAKTFKGPAANQGLVRSTGTGSLESSRGSFHVYADLNHDGVPELVTGEVDVLGNPWPHASWGANAWSSSPWLNYEGEWSGWTAAGQWTKKSWAGTSWDANSWSKKSWADAGWSANSWSSVAWDVGSWN